MDASLKNGTELPGLNRKIICTVFVLALAFFTGDVFSNLQVHSDEIAWHAEDWGRWREISLHSEKTDDALQGFTEMQGQATGIDFQNFVNPERAIRNRNLYGGSGVAIGDFDGDGWPDLYFCRLEGSNALYRNLGDWKFEEVTAEYKLELQDQDSTSAVFVDMNGDGWLDLLVGGLGAGVRYFENRHGVSFEENTDEVGLRSKSGSVSLALNDYDGSVCGELST